MFRFRKFCVFDIQCCFLASDGSNLETGDQDIKSPKNPDFTSPKSFQKNINITAVEVSKLTLIILDTVHMVVGSEYEIFPYGLKSSKRSVKDGCVYAGSMEKHGKLIVNDIILPEKEKGIGKRHFMINHNKGNSYSDQGNYFIKDMGEGLGTFIRIDKPIKLKSSYIVSFGDSHMIVQIDNSVLTIRFIEGPKVDFKSFSPDESPIKIGRMIDCHIRFEDTSLSRYHCTLIYKDNWVIVDGDGEKQSTNGTWLFAEQFFEVFDGMVFKVGETLIRAQITTDLTNVYG